MTTIRHPFDDPRQHRIREILNNDGVMVFPTETFYAIGCLATSIPAIERVYDLKQRQADAPLLVLIDSWEMLAQHADGLTPHLLETLRQYWPGALTAVLKSSGSLPAQLNITGDTLGFRMTSSPAAAELIGIAGVPLVGTSANRSNGDSISDFDRTQAVFANRVDLYIDGGTTAGGQPSTVVDMTDENNFHILREGAVPFDPD